MTILSSLPLLGALFTGLTKRFATDKDKLLESQSRINEAEVAGAPASRLRLWRGFLGWVLALVLAFEVVVRPVIVTYFPDIALPPSMLQEISSILLTMLGVGI